MPFSYGNVKCLGLEGNLNECEVTNATQDCTQDDEVIIFCTSMLIIDSKWLNITN